jgi:hypothetical protein
MTGSDPKRFDDDIRRSTLEKIINSHEEDWTANNWAAKAVVIIGVVFLLAFGLFVGGCAYWLIHTLGG